MKSLLYFTCSLIFATQIFAEVSTGELKAEQRTIKSHIDQADLEIDEARKDVGVALTSTAWMRVITAGAELDSATLLMRNHPQKIAEWSGLFVTQSRRDEMMAEFKNFMSMHGDVNRVVLSMQNDLSRMLGVDFNYIRTVLRTLKQLCETTGDPKWCDAADRIEAKFKAGQFEGAYSEIDKIKGDLEKENVHPEDKGIIESGPKVGSNSEGKSDDRDKAQSKAKAEAQSVLDALLAKYEETGDPRYKELYDQLKKRYDSGDYNAVVSKGKSGVSEIDRSIAADQSSASSSGGKSGAKSNSGNSTGLQLSADNTVEIDGKTYFFPNGFDDPGFVAGYTGGQGTRLTSERKILMAFTTSDSGEYKAEPKEVDRRDWDFDIRVKNTVETDDGQIGIIELVDLSGKTGFTIDGWQVQSTANKVLQSSSDEDLELVFSEDLPSEIIIVVKGKSEWGSSFKIAVTLTL